MHGRDDVERLEVECHALCRYLIGARADAYVAGKYVQAHAVGSIAPAADDCDVVLAWAAARGPILARFADAYASVFARQGLLRRKLALLLAILETRLDSYRALDAPITTSRAALIAQLGARTCATAVSAAVAAAVLVPILAVRRLMAARQARPR
jgi:hypothetical protein